MQAIRQYDEDAPASVAIPESMRHQRLVVIMQMQAAPANQSRTGLKALLCSMPNVGDESDFARQADVGRAALGTTTPWQGYAPSCVQAFGLNFPEYGFKCIITT
jgi:hypothetical protein